LWRGGRCRARQRFFRAPQFDESSFPSSLDFASNEPVVRIDMVELTLGKRGRPAGGATEPVARRACRTASSVRL
jgi:hypothetical protein